MYTDLQNITRFQIIKYDKCPREEKSKQNYMHIRLLIMLYINVCVCILCSCIKCTLINLPFLHFCKGPPLLWNFASTMLYILAFEKAIVRDEDHLKSLVVSITYVTYMTVVFL